RSPRATDPQLFRDPRSVVPHPGWPERCSRSSKRDRVGRIQEMTVSHVGVTGWARERSSAGLHWAKRPLPEPPRSRRVSKWTRLPLDPMQEALEEWLRDQSVSYTYDGD